MAVYSGAYTRSGDPEALFTEELRRLAGLFQIGKAAVDADFNDISFSVVHQMRRIIENTIGDGSPNSGFLIVESGSPSNNFTITGGTGTDDGAGRFFGAGLPAVLNSDVEYSAAFDARMLRVMPQVTSVTALTLTDSAANWAVDEHAGKTFTPDVAIPATTFTVTSNTATVLTIGAGDLTAATDATKHYRIELTTASGGPRVDEVFLDLFLDEVDEFEDPNLIHTDLTPDQASANRLALRQYVRVTEGLTAPADYVDTDGRQHYIFLIATLNRPDATADVLTAQIVDERRAFVLGSIPLIVTELDLAPSVSGVSTIKFPSGTVTDEGGGVVSVDSTGGGIVVLATITGVDTKAQAATNIFLVPGGKTAVILGFVARVESDTAITVGPEVGVGVAAGEDDVTPQQALTGLFATGEMFTVQPTGKSRTVATGLQIKFGVDVVATGTAQTIAVDLLGYLL